MIDTVKEFFKFFEIVLNQIVIEMTNLRRTEMQPELKLILHWLLTAYWYLIASFIRGCAFIVNSIIFIYEMLFVGLLNILTYIQKEYIRIKLWHRMHNPPKIDEEQLKIDKQRWEEWEASEEGKEYLKQLEQKHKQTKEGSK
mgnify:FL=1